MTSVKTVIKAEAILVSELLKKGLFSVPWHQRCYDWSPSDVTELLTDIDVAMRNRRSCYFIGAVITVKTANGQWAINDGQQRMVTISLILSSLCKRLSEVSTYQTKEARAICYLFDQQFDNDPLLKHADDYTPRITLHEQDRVPFEQIIRGYSIGTNGKLLDAWNAIETHLSTNDMYYCTKLFDFLTKKLEVAWLQVPKKVDPNSVFETINCRGKPLDDFDLIRNYIYSIFNSKPEKQRTIHDCLERIKNAFQTGAQAESYLRCHLQCVFGFLGKDKFYRGFREALQQKRKNITHDTKLTLKLVKELADPASMGLYKILASKNPDSEYIQNFESMSGTVRSPRKLSILLYEMHGYTVTRPLLFALLKKYFDEQNPIKQKNLSKVIHYNIKLLSAFVLRTAFVAPLQPSHFEEEFSNYAKIIMENKTLARDEFKKFLISCDRSEFGVLDNKKFMAIMSETNIKATQKVKLLLAGISRYGNSNELMLSIEHCTVEHILPKSEEYWEFWTGFDNVAPEDWIYKIGNQTLLSFSDNKAGNKFNTKFEEKRKVYQESNISISRELGEYNLWSPDTIKKRQQKMLKKAIQVWKFK